MLSNTSLQVETADILTLISVLLTAAGLIVAFIKLWSAFKERLDLKIDDAKKDMRSYTNDHVKSTLDKIETYEAYNSRAHAEMRNMIDTCENRSSQADHDLKEDYVRGIEAVNKRLDDIVRLLKNRS